MSSPIRPINPGQTFNIGSRDHLTQVQHKFDYVDIVDHFDKGKLPAPLHIVTRVDRFGRITTELE